MALSPRNFPSDILDAAVELMGRSGRLGTVRVRGTSMEPTLCETNVVAVDFAPRRVQRGDLVLFRQNDLLIVHRLVGRGRRRGVAPYLRARGDARIRLDPPVAPDWVVGRVVALDSGHGWRSLRGGRARAYAWLVAWHDLAWAALGAVARAAERGLAGVGVRVHLEARAHRLDRLLLHGAHRMLFERMHARIDSPSATAS
jgi:hypothetical protein